MGFCDSLLDVSWQLQEKAELWMEHCVLTAMNVSDLFYDLLRILIVYAVQGFTIPTHIYLCPIVSTCKSPGFADFPFPALKRLKISIQSSVKLVRILNLSSRSTSSRLLLLFHFMCFWYPAPFINKTCDCHSIRAKVRVRFSGTNLPDSDVQIKKCIKHAICLPKVMRKVVPFQALF